MCKDERRKRNNEQQKAYRARKAVLKATATTATPSVEAAPATGTYISPPLSVSTASNSENETVASDSSRASSVVSEDAGTGRLNCSLTTRLEAMDNYSVISKLASSLSSGSFSLRWIMARSNHLMTCTSVRYCIITYVMRSNSSKTASELDSAFIAR